LKNEEEILEFFKSFQNQKRVELLDTFGSSFPFIERKKTTEEIYKIIEERNKKKNKNKKTLKDKQNVTLPFVGYLPGSGKSRNATELMNVLQKTDKEKKLNLLQNGIQILVNFGNGNKLIRIEKDDIITSFSIRLLLGYFGLGNYSFKQAIKLIHQKISNIFEIDIEYAMDMILKDLMEKENPYFIISIDEFQKVFINLTF
jgi:DNA polymerase elongation subunit (family B)